MLLVMGLGMTAAGWWRTVPVLADAGLEVIAFDNRGVGRSGRPAGPYDTGSMADDAVAVLEACGHLRAHVYGLSLGGMIAQEIALRHPDRVDRLVLGATTPGESAGTPPDPSVIGFFHRRATMPAAEAVWASVPYNYGSRTRVDGGDRIAQDIRRRLQHPIEVEPYTAQLAAALGHDAGNRLPSIAAKTLIVHGGEDRMVPPANADALASLIPLSTVITFPGAGHLYFTDEPAADAHIASFLT